MGVPRPNADPNANLYEQLKRDVLNRLPQVTNVGYEPDPVRAKRLRATFAPERLEPPTGPESPTLTVAWIRGTRRDWFRVDYADPNTGLHAGWHQDGDHPDLGPCHRQVTTPDGATERAPFGFEFETPSRRLWEIINDLLENVVPRAGGTQE
jgi:hypothetical protein